MAEEKGLPISAESKSISKKKEFKEEQKIKVYIKDGFPYDYDGNHLFDRKHEYDYFRGTIFRVFDVTNGTDIIKGYEIKVTGKPVAGSKRRNAVPPPSLWEPRPTLRYRQFVDVKVGDRIRVYLKQGDEAKYLARF